MTKHLVKLFANRIDPDDEDDLESRDKPFQVFAQPLTSTNYEIYLSSAVVEPAAYDSLCALLRGMTERDSVQFYINSPGGSLAGGMAIIQAMRDSPALITTVLHPRGYSMGALLFLAGDILDVRENCQLMFHHYSSVLHGKGNEQAAEVNASVSWYGAIARELCFGFLTEEELDAMLQGKDFWMQTPEIEERVHRMAEAREAVFAERYAEAAKAAEMVVTEAAPVEAVAAPARRRTRRSTPA